jgi:hypothetical protein
MLKSLPAQLCGGRDANLSHSRSKVDHELFGRFLKLVTSARLKWTQVAHLGPYWLSARGTLSARLKAALKARRHLIIVDSKAGARTSNVARELTGPVLICGLCRRKPQNCRVARLHFHSCSVGAA